MILRKLQVYIISSAFSARLFFYVGLILLLVSPIVACGSTTPALTVDTPKTQPPATVENQQPTEGQPSQASTDDTEWNIVKSFIGKENTTTSTFSISGSKWRITWTADTQDPQYTVLNILVYRQNGPAMLINSILYSKDTPSDPVIIDEGGHDYYLEIICANLNKWTVNVEEYEGKNTIPSVQITSIHYKGMNYYVTGASGHQIVEWDEYVEIKNLSDSPQNIAGWTLKNITKGAPTFIFPSVKPCSCNYLGSWSKCVKQCYPPHPCTIDPRSSIRVYTGEPNWATGGYCFYHEPGDIWNNETPDTAVLYNAEGQEVSRKSYSIYSTK